MKPTLINNGLEPPEKRELDREEFERHALNFVKQYYKLEQVFDTYTHDREVSIRFHKWMMDYNSVHLVDILSDKPQPTYDELWELFCRPDNILPLHEGKEFDL